MEVNFQSTDVAGEKQSILLPFEEEESEQEIFARKALGEQRAMEEEEQELWNKVTDVFKIPLSFAVKSFGAMEKNAHIRKEQHANPLLRAVNFRILHAEYDKHLLKIKLRGRIRLIHEERMFMKDGILKRKYYREYGTVTNHQTIIPKH